MNGIAGVVVPPPALFGELIMNQFNPLGRRVSMLASLVLAMVTLASNTAAAADYKITDLGANVSPQDINNLGEVAGAMDTDQYPSKAFYGLPGAFANLDGTVANAINDSGTVAGNTITGAFVFNGNNFRSWDQQYAYGVNELGNVSGMKAGKNPYRPASPPWNPAVLEGKNWTVLDIAGVYPRGTRQGVYVDVYALMDVNNAGYAVGSRRRAGLVGSSAILITPPYSAIKSMADVDYLPVNAGGAANAINEDNLIAGTSGNDSRSGLYASAFVYDGVSAQYMLPLAGGLRSGAADINDFDQVVGYSESSEGNRAILWDVASGAVQDLNDLLAAGSGWVLSSATAINNAAEIVGVGTLNGQPHGFLLSTGETQTPLNQPPVAIASSDVSSGKVALVVNFTGSDSYDPDGAIEYSWDFGDGAGSVEANPSHTYTETGTYLAELTVTDDGGLIDSVIVQITVRKNGGKH